jgi:RNA polymerase sigma factor (sigma-70 family)
VEASALQAQAGLARNRSGLGISLLRLRSDEQLVELFRNGHDEAFRTIHDRYRQRLFAYTRQMLPGARADAEDALQDVFVRAYSGLRANDRELTLRAWLYRVAHNRCVDELRRPIPPAPEVLGILRAPTRDPVLEAEQRDSLRQLVRDVRQLPEQQRSALLMRELGGMPYTDIAGALGTSVAAVKSLLVRARVGLAQAAEARDTACVEIREELILAHDRGVRASGLARRHMHECASCRTFRTEIRGVSRKFAAMVAPIGPLGMVAHLLGFGGGGGAAAAGGGAGAGAGAAGAGAAAAGGGAATAGAGFVAVGHVATLLAAAVVTAGGAVELQHTLSAPARHAHAVRHASRAPAPAPVSSPTATAPTGAATDATNPAGAGMARSAASAPRSPSTTQSKTAPARRTARGSVSELSSTSTASASASGGSGLGDGSTSGGASGVSSTTGTGTGAPIPLPGSTGSVPSGDDTSPGTTTGDPTGTPDGTSDGTTSVPPVSTTSDPNATTSSAGGASGSPTTSGSAGTSSNTTSGSSGSGGSGSNWPL